MKKDDKDPLHVIQGDDLPHSPSDRNETPKEDSPKAEEAGEEGAARPIFTVPEGYLLAQEMSDLFEEDIVTHVQGSSEPEAD